MEYRALGERVTERISALGFGCMRLPKLRSGIDEKEARRLLRYAIDHGVNYIDTAYPYHDGESEPVVGRALQDGYRERILLATKLPIWQIESIADCDSVFDEQLSRLKTDHIDFYLLHALNNERWQKILRLGILEWALEQKRAGRVRYIGFSFHDEPPMFPVILDGWKEWDFCQIQYNYVNEEYQAGTAGLRRAAARGIGVVVMEPLLGGSLIRQPESVRRIFDSASSGRGAAAWALHWLWNKPEVGVVLSGMTTFEQVLENIAIAEGSRIGRLSEAELALFSDAKTAYEAARPVPCTSCNYCMPCPNDVDIPANFAIYNDSVAFGRLDVGRQQYKNDIAVEKRASSCIQCDECLEKCPQNIAIPDRLAEVDAAFTT